MKYLRAMVLAILLILGSLYPCFGMSSFEESTLTLSAMVSAEQGFIYSDPFDGEILTVLSKGDEVAISFFGGDWEWFSTEVDGVQAYICVGDVEAFYEETFVNRDCFIFEDRPKYGESDFGVRKKLLKKDTQLLVLGNISDSVYHSAYVVVSEDKQYVGLIPSSDYLGEISSSWNEFSDCMIGYALGDTKLYETSDVHGKAVGELRKGDVVHIVEMVNDMYFVTNGKENAYVLQGMVSLWYVNPDLPVQEFRSGWSLGWNS